MFHIEDLQKKKKKKKVIFRNIIGYYVGDVAN